MQVCQMGSVFLWNGVLSWCVFQILSNFFRWCCEMKFLSITLLVKRFQTALFQITTSLFLGTTFSNNPIFNNLKNKLYQMGWSLGASHSCKFSLWFGEIIFCGLWEKILPHLSSFQRVLFSTKQRKMVTTHLFSFI